MAKVNAFYLIGVMTFRSENDSRSVFDPFLLHRNIEWTDPWINGRGKTFWPECTEIKDDKRLQLRIVALPR